MAGTVRFRNTCYCKTRQPPPAEARDARMYAELPSSAWRILVHFRNLFMLRLFEIVGLDFLALIICSGNPSKVAR